jgi:molybdopterin converting factor subunit 1
MASAKVSLLYFAQAREIAGTEKEETKVPSPSTVEKIVLSAAKSHPGLRKLRQVIRVAVNQQVVDGVVDLRDGDEVALLPPVMGG